MELVPEPHSLSGFALEPGCHEGIAVGSLEVGTTLLVRTRNSTYRLIILDENGGVLVQGGALFSEPRSAVLQGASAGGSLVKAGWIGVGLRLELQAGSERICTSPVESIRIESVPPAPSARRDF